jgi:hypothetical protein
MINLPKENPFNDFIKNNYSQLDAYGNERAWQHVAEEMRSKPRERISRVLNQLTRVYREALENNGQVKALEVFETEIVQLHDIGFLTDNMLVVLQEAQKGNIKAGQYMIQANPETIHLPFIAQILRYVILQFKYCDAGRGVLKDIKASWNNFLPKRSGGAVSYSDSDLQMLIDLAYKQNQTHVSLVAEHLNISVEYIKKALSRMRKKVR